MWTEIVVANYSCVICVAFLGTQLKNPDFKEQVKKVRDSWQIWKWGKMSLAQDADVEQHWIKIYVQMGCH